jgi:tetratricopeptide (TPR) repeat protein
VSHAIACVLLASISLFGQEAGWLSTVRSEVARKNLDGATSLVEQRLRASPDDLEAHAWRARLLAWQGGWPEAEAEYRLVLQKAASDTEIMAGLADVLAWQGKLEDALSVLDRARSILPLQTSTLNRRARLLARLKRPQDARAEYQAALRLNANDREARAGLASLAGEGRHELRFGLEADSFNYTDTAAAQSVVLISRWNSRWTTTLSSTTYQRFGANAESFTARLSRRLGNNWFTVGGGAGHDEGVIPRRELALEYGRGFRIGGNGLVRGIEFSLGPQWFRYRDSKAFTLTSAASFYLPRDWMWSLRWWPRAARFRWSEWSGNRREARGCRFPSPRSGCEPISALPSARKISPRPTSSGASPPAASSEA